MLNRETLKVEEYEKKEYIEYFYNREDRVNKRKRKKTTYKTYITEGEKSSPKLLNSIETKNKKKPKKKYKFIFILNIVFLIIAFIIFLISSSFKNSASIYEEDLLTIKMATINLENNELNIYLYFTNTSDVEKKIEIGKETELHLLNDKEIVFSEKLELPNTIVLDKNGNKNSEFDTSFTIKLKNNINYDKAVIRLYIPHEIVLKEELKNNNSN